MKDTLFNILGHHPFIGVILSILQLLVGTFQDQIQPIANKLEGVSPLVKDFFQLGAWGGAFLVAIVTIIVSIKTHTKLLDKIKFFKHESNNKKSTK